VILFSRTLLVIIAASLFVFSCGGSKRVVKRVGVDEQVDISGRWNDNDAAMAAQTLIKDVLSKGWLDDFKDENDRKPVLIVGRIRNKTTEHLDVNVMIKDIEKELINSGRVKFVASKKQREEIRDERLDQQSYAAMETAKELANELGADFVLQGEVSSIVDSFEGKRAVLYKVNLELLNIEDNSKVWIGDKKIKKVIKQKKYEW